MKTATAPLTDASAQSEPVPTREDQRRELIRYRQGVEELMLMGSKKSISNGQSAHAAILFEIFFKYVDKQVRIFCRNLNAEVFNSPELLEAANWALAERKKIRVIVQDDPQESAFLNLLRGKASSDSNVELMRAPEDVREKPFNFAVMDERAVRVEPNRKDHKATASMNLPDVAKTWASYFDDLAIRSTPVGA